MRPALLLAAAVLAAGCAAPAQEPVVPAALVPLPDGGGLVAHDASGILPLPAGWSDLEMRLAPTGAEGGEPTVGVTSDGAVFVPAFGVEELAPGFKTARPATLRSDDAGRSWTDVTGALGARASFDPWLWVDPLTDRVYATHLTLDCTWVAWSDDGGATWTENPLGGCGLPLHDHQKLTTGPPAAGVLTVGYPNVVYYAYNTFLVAPACYQDTCAKRLGTVVSVSLDGGRSWTPGTVAHDADACHRGLNGPVAVAPDGTAYLPKPTCEGVDVMLSKDSGLTWSLAHRIDDGGGPRPFGIEPTDVAVDEDGTAFLAYRGNDGLVHVAAGRDDAWGPSFAVAPPGVNVTAFAAVVAGAPGRLAVAYLGSDADPARWPSNDPSEAPAGTVWHLYVTWIEDARAADPVRVTARLTPQDDPVQVGCIWLRGGANDCRNLYDFIDATEHEGRLHVAYTDGCLACPAEGQSGDGIVAVAVQENGPGLRGATVAPTASAPRIVR